MENTNLSQNESFSSLTNNDGIVALILNITNEERLDSGREKLSLNIQLSQAAQSYAELMAFKETMGHDVDGQTVRIRLQQVGYKWNTYGENVAWNTKLSAQGVMNQWMGSSGHRRNILNGRYTEIGIGVAGPSRRGRYYYCQIFGRPLFATLTEENIIEGSSSIFVIDTIEE